jgi:hypothetical protein
MFGRFLIELLKWSEVWALLIPLSVLLIRRSSPALLLPIPIYLGLAFLLNLCITLVANVPAFTHLFHGSNHIFYNLHSVAKVVFFGWFIQRYLPIASANIVKLIFIFYGAFVLLNFTLFENPLVFSSRLLTVESILLLFLGITWYLYTIQDDELRDFKKEVVFLVITGLTIYEGVCFFIFLVYKQLIVPEQQFAILIWKVHDVAFIILNLFLARACMKASVRPAGKLFSRFAHFSPLQD